LKYVLENEVRELGYAWSNKLGKTKMMTVDVKIPINEKGEFDFAKQREIAAKYEQIHQTRKSVTQHLQELAEIVVNM